MAPYLVINNMKLRQPPVPYRPGSVVEKQPGKAKKVKGWLGTGGNNQDGVQTSKVSLVEMQPRHPKLKNP